MKRCLVLLTLTYSASMLFSVEAPVSNNNSNSLLAKENRTSKHLLFPKFAQASFGMNTLIKKWIVEEVNCPWSDEKIQTNTSNITLSRSVFPMVRIIGEKVSNNNDQKPSAVKIIAGPLFVPEKEIKDTAGQYYLVDASLTVKGCKESSPYDGCQLCMKVKMYGSYIFDSRIDVSLPADDYPSCIEIDPFQARLLIGTLKGRVYNCSIFEIKNLSLFDNKYAINPEIPAWHSGKVTAIRVTKYGYISYSQNLNETFIWGNGASRPLAFLPPEEKDGHDYLWDDHIRRSHAGDKGYIRANDGDKIYSFKNLSWYLNAEKNLTPLNKGLLYCGALRMLLHSEDENTRLLLFEYLPKLPVRECFGVEVNKIFDAFFAEQKETLTSTSK
jgi:hypothetical protein